MTVSPIAGTMLRSRRLATPTCNYTITATTLYVLAHKRTNFQPNFDTETAAYAVCSQRQNLQDRAKTKASTLNAKDWTFEAKAFMYTARAEIKTGLHRMSS